MKLVKGVHEVHGGVILHLHKLLHNYSVSITENDHIDAGFEAGDIELRYRGIAFLCKYHHTCHVHDSNDTLLIFHAVKSDIQYAVGWIWVCCQSHLSVTSYAAAESVAEAVGGIVVGNVKTGI